MALASTYLAVLQTSWMNRSGALSRRHLGVQLVAVVGVEQDVELDVGVLLLEHLEAGGHDVQALLGEERLVGDLHRRPWSALRALRRARCPRSRRRRSAPGRRPPPGPRTVQHPAPPAVSAPSPPSCSWPSLWRGRCYHAPNRDVTVSLPAYPREVERCRPSSTSVRRASRRPCPCCPGRRARSGRWPAGTDLLVQLRAERYTLQRVVDVKAIPELNELRLSLAEGLTLGAAVPCYRIYEDAAIKAAYPGAGRLRLDHRRHRHPGPGHPRRQPLQRLPRGGLDPLPDRARRDLQHRRAGRPAPAPGRAVLHRPRAATCWSRASCSSPSTSRRPQPRSGSLLPALHPPQRDGHRRRRRGALGRRWATTGRPMRRRPGRARRGRARRRSSSTRRAGSLVGKPGDEEAIAAGGDGGPGGGQARSPTCAARTRSAATWPAS